MVYCRTNNLKVNCMCYLSSDYLEPISETNPGANDKITSKQN